MYIYQQAINLKKNQQLIIIPLGDIQGTEQIDRLDRLVQWCVEREKEGHLVRMIGTGDYFETFSPSERKKLAGAAFHETTLETINQTNIAQADDFAHRLKPMRKRVMVMLQGHHWSDLHLAKRTIPSDQYIAEKLDAEYAGDGTALIRLLINGVYFRIFAMHGYGGGRMLGGRVNKRVNMRSVLLNCNLYFMGHDNEKLSIPQEPLYDQDNPEDPVYLKQYFCGVGSFQESYHFNTVQAGYAERAAYTPSSLGVVMCTLRVEERNGKKRHDYHIST